MPKKRRAPALKQKKFARRAAHRIDVTLPPGVFKEIEDLIKEGSFFSMSDFARAAIREKLDVLGSAKRKK